MPEEYFKCERMDRMTNAVQCGVCVSNQTVRNNFRKRSIIMEVEWKEKPCAFEIMNGMSVEDSISNNTWVSGRTRAEEIEYQEGVLQRMIDRKSRKCEINNQKKYIKGLKL